jgi:ABC-2 type transport system ATP-binding protein
VIEARNQTKKYGEKVAVDDHLTFTVQPGKVTGSLRPNGTGTSTAMRMFVRLDTPTSGSVTVDERPYGGHARPLSAIGALLEVCAVHTSPSVYKSVHDGISPSLASGTPCAR